MHPVQAHHGSSFAYPFLEVVAVVVEALVSWLEAAVIVADTVT